MALCRATQSRASASWNRVHKALTDDVESAFRREVSL